MAYLYRVVCSLLLALAASTAVAQASSITFWTVEQVPGQRYPSSWAACTAALPVLQAASTDTLSLVDLVIAETVHGCLIRVQRAGASDLYQALAQANKNVIPGCVPPQVLNASGTGCATNTNNCPKAGVDAGWWHGQGRSGEKSMCSTQSAVPSGDPSANGCRIKGFASIATGGNSGPNADPSGWTWGAQMAYTGEKCSPDPAQPPAAPEPNSPKCVPPKVQGTGPGGVEICYTPSPGSPKSNTPSNSQSPPKTTVTNNPDGSSRTQTSSSATNCENGTCTTTITHSTSTTSPTGTTSPPEVTTTTSTCRMGPGCGPVAPVSGTNTTTTNTSTSPTGTTTTTSTTTPTGNTNGAGGTGSSGTGGGSGGNGNGEGEASQFAGQCGAPPFCDGDAIMCAVAAATFKTNCAMTTPPTTDEPEVALYKAEAAKSQGAQVGVGESTVNVGPSNFDQTNLLGAAVGMPDLTISVMGKSIVLPFSMVNVWLERLGLILRAITLLICARILIRG